jgi:tetratricopeptide (TPR) repeat protein
MTEPGDLEALYEQGMAHYQKREWRAALEQFRQLKALQPNWPGLDALVDEVSWFLQLENVGSAPGQPAEAETPAVRRRRWSNPLLTWLAVLLLFVVALGALAAWQGLLHVPGLGLGRTLEQEALFNRGQASLAVGDFAAARAAFAELARLAPNDPAAQAGLTRASSLENADLAWQAAETAIAAGDWDTAQTQLRVVLTIDPHRTGLGERLSYVEHQRQAAGLFAAGVAAYDTNRQEEAIEALEGLTTLDPEYQRDAVRELLFILYLRDGNQLLAAVDADADAIRQALGRFGQALALRPRNVQAAEESQLANQYLNARLALGRQDWDQAQSLLGGILRQRPDYAGGQAGEQLYTLLVRQGDDARARGELAQAQRAYEQALALPQQVAPDRSTAQAGLLAVRAQGTPTAEAALPAASLAPQPTPSVLVEIPTLNVRLGPGTDYPMVGQAQGGDRLALVGRNEAGDWLVICCIDERPGWIAARLVTLPEGVDVNSLPVGLAPTRPAPTATPLPPPTPTATATAIGPAVTDTPPLDRLPEPPAPTATPTEQPR